MPGPVGGPRKAAGNKIVTILNHRQFAEMEILHESFGRS